MNFLNLFGKRREPQTIDVDYEIGRVANYMNDYYDCIHEINVPKKYIVERDYLSIWHGICSIIRNSVTNVCDTECLSGNHQWNLSSDMTNVAAKVIDKLYEIDWE